VGKARIERSGGGCQIGPLLGHGGFLDRSRSKKYAEAEPVLLRALGLRTKAFGEPQVRTQRTIKNLGDLYEQSGKPKQSRAYRARLVPAETTRPPKADPRQ
jgi:hypothetical protein